MKKLNIKLKVTDDLCLLHDTRGDVRILLKVCNELINKVNELVEKINELEKDSDTR